MHASMCQCKAEADVTVVSVGPAASHSSVQSQTQRTFQDVFSDVSYSLRVSVVAPRGLPASHCQVGGMSTVALFWPVVDG
jgi:hypothetical protein